ncbi:MAG: DUF445 family protein, partial [Pyrinomonadaceae bacterium]
VLARPIQDLIGQVSQEKMESIKNGIATRLLVLARSPEVASVINNYVSDALARLAPHHLRTLLQYFRPAAETSPQLKSFLAKGLVDILRRDDTVVELNAFLDTQIERLLVAPIGRPSDYISEESITHATDTLSEGITAIARKRLPDAISEFDVGGIVRRKINDYPAEKLEELVLSVAQQHLRTIEIFGAVIGLMIGIFQAFYFWYLNVL